MCGRVTRVMHGKEKTSEGPLWRPHRRSDRAVGQQHFPASALPPPVSARRHPRGRLRAETLQREARCATSPAALAAFADQGRIPCRPLPCRRPSAACETPAFSRGVQRPGIRRTLDQEKAHHLYRKIFQKSREKGAAGPKWLGIQYRCRNVPGGRVINPGAWTCGGWKDSSAI
jgi:hypothetical protein